MSAHRRNARPAAGASRPQTVPIILATAALTVAALAVRYPAGLILWAGLLIAAWASAPPEFTGARARGGDVEPAGAYERQLLARHRSWIELRWRLVWPAALWPGTRFALAPLAAALAGIAAAQLPLRDAPLELRLGEDSAAALTLPGLPAEELDLLRWLSGAALAIVVLQLPASFGAHASQFAPRPRVGVVDLIGLARTSPPALVAAAAAAVVAGVAAGVGVLLLPIIAPGVADWLPADPAAFAWAAAGAAALGTVIAVVGPGARRGWQEHVAAAERWQQLWTRPELRLTEPPTLVEHLSWFDAALQVDTFDAPSVGSAAMLEQLKHSPGAVLPRLLGGMVDVAVLDVPRQGRDGAPEPGTRSDIRFRVATVQRGALPDITSPDTPPELARLTVEIAAAWAAAAVQSPPPILHEWSAITAGQQAGDAAHRPWWRQLLPAFDDDALREDAPQGAPGMSDDAGDARPTAAWAAVLDDATGQGSVDQFVALAADLLTTDTAAAEVEAYRDGQIVYVGAVTAPTTNLQDPALHGRLADLATIAAWHGRWRDTTAAAGIAAGAVPHDAEVAHARHLQVDPRLFDERAAQRPGRPAAPLPILEVLPFRVLQGVNVGDYLRARTEDCLVSTLAGAPWLHLTAWPEQGRGARPGTRSSTAFAVVWSAQPLPTNPAKVPATIAVNPREHREVAGYLFNGIVAHAFDAAKLARPEVVEAENLTGEETLNSIWRVRIRLHGDVTVEAIRKKAAAVQAQLGCAWFHVTAAPAADQALLVMGDRPDAGTVAFSGPRAHEHREWCTRVEWEAAFLTAKVVGENGALPRLQHSELLRENTAITRNLFSIPSGKTVGDFVERREQLRTEVDAGWLEVRPGATAASVELLTAAENPMPYPAPMDWPALREQQPSRIPFGTSVEGTVVSLDLDFDPHLLVVGGTGTGKSITLLGILTAFLLSGTDCLVADPVKGGADFAPVLPWLRAFCGDRPDVLDNYLEAAALLDWVAEEKDRRKALNARHGVGSYLDLPEPIRPRRMLLLIDEFTSLVETERATKPTGDESPELLQALEEARQLAQAKATIGARVGQLAREARSAGIHLLLAGQKLDSKTLDRVPGGSTLRGSMARLALGQLGWGDLSAALRDPGAAQHLRVPDGRRGCGIFESNAPGPTGLVQSWYGTADRRVEHKTAILDELEQRVARVPDRIDLNSIVAARRTAAPVFGQLVAAAEEEAEPEALDLEFDFDSDDGADDAPPAGCAPESAAEKPMQQQRGAPTVVIDVDAVASAMMPLGDWPDPQLVQLPDGPAWVAPLLLERLARLRADLLWTGAPDRAEALSAQCRTNASTPVTDEALPEAIRRAGRLALVGAVRAPAPPGTITVAVPPGQLLPDVSLADLEAQFGSDAQAVPPQPAAMPPEPVAAPATDPRAPVSTPLLPATRAAPTGRLRFDQPPKQWPQPPTPNRPPLPF